MKINTLIALLPPKPISDTFSLSFSCESLLNLRFGYLDHALNLMVCFPSINKINFKQQY